MWRLVRVMLAILIIGGGIYYWRDHVKVFALQAYHEIAPCSLSITYSIGAIDPRFGISTSSLRSSLEAAERSWESAADKELFEFATTGGSVVVNLVYDIRQETTEKLKTLGVTVSNNLESYESVRAKYSSVHAKYIERKAAFNTAYAAYQHQASLYEQDVNRWNARGGAPESVYKDLNKKKAALDAEEERLKKLQEQVNADANDVNALVSALNHLAGTLNMTVAKYNTVGQEVGGEFEEALFESRPGSQEINVYEFDSTERLRRVLTHEFGHALGLEHVDDEEAIMFRLNQGKNQTLTAADITELKAVCRL